MEGLVIVVFMAICIIGVIVSDLPKFKLPRLKKNLPEFEEKVIQCKETYESIYETYYESLELPDKEFQEHCRGLKDSAVELISYWESRVRDTENEIFKLEN